MDINIPNLESFCGSWVVVSRKTGEAIFETFDQEIARRVNQDKYKVLTAGQYLSGLNKKGTREV